MSRWRKLGIIAGGGALPARIASACAERDEPFYVVRLQGFADKIPDQLPGRDCSS